MTRSQPIKFTPDDFKGHGQVVVRCSYNGTDHQFGASVLYKIGYESANNMHLKVSLADGWTIRFRNLNSLCDDLNSDQIGYRFVTTDEFLLMSQFINRGKAST